MAGLPTYSIAIRTLGKAGEAFGRELASITRQTCPPEKVVVYLAEGYDLPDGLAAAAGAEVVRVSKGMVAQRALRYDEMDSECILMLDDDVELAPDGAEKLLLALAENSLDCISADVFRNQDLPPGAKLRAAAGNLVFPHFDRKWAFKVCHNGSFSYNARPRTECLRSQCCGGPLMLWRKSAFLRLHMEDERWLDRLGFAYGDDQLESFKLHVNGGRLGVLYGPVATHLDAGSASGIFRNSPQRVFVRAKASTMIWYRSLYRTGKDTVESRLKTAVAFGLKALWMSLVYLLLSVPALKPGYLLLYVKGVREGLSAARSGAFRNLHPYHLP